MFFTNFRKHLAITFVATALLFSVVNFTFSFNQNFNEELRFSESETDNLQDDFTFLTTSETQLHLQKIFFAVFLASISFLIPSKRRFVSLPRSPPRTS